MALKDILQSFTAVATAAGVSEEGYYHRAVRKAQAGDTTDLDAINAEAVSQSDTDAQTEISAALSDSSTVSSASGDLLSTNNLSDVADAATARSNLGAGTGDLLAANNLSDVANAATARSNLGAGTGDGDLLAANNLSDVANAATARSNLGAGTGDGDLLAANNLSDVSSAITARSNLAAGKGIVSISPSAGDNADYTFTGTASYASAVADARLANGGILFFYPGTFTFDTNPTWAKNVIHMGAGHEESILELPDAQTSTGASADGQYRFEGLLMRPPGGVGTHTISLTAQQQFILRDSIIDYDVRLNVQGNYHRNLIENCSIGYNGGALQHDWSDSIIFVTDSWFFSTNGVLVNNVTSLHIRGVDSFKADYTSASGNVQIQEFIGCTALTLTSSNTGAATNCMFLGCSNISEDKTSWQGHYAGNRHLDNNDFNDRGDVNTNQSITVSNGAGVGIVQKMRLTGNITVTGIQNVGIGQTMKLIIEQDGTGSRLVTSWPGNVVWMAGVAPTLKTAAAAVDVITFLYDGTNLYGDIQG